ncbi:integrase and RNaseH domain-containing protein [Golovinomyces cichoracearum]|uniref:Integrase and RNaseH domain-containing protein n=1 Tax=Golovinomyces cichoracearum TaxID=62708 RepID=A0A420J554_9PEZI|nr:integrase and RNaseH domain-containing protein [Golovinomyces cichoracearum]
MVSVSYAKTLQECVDNDKPHRWTKDEILDHLEEYRGEFDSVFNPNNVKLKTSKRLPILGWTEDGGILYASDRAQASPEMNGYSRSLIGIMRIYSSDDKKYGGEEYDFLEIKLQIFYDFQKVLPKEYRTDHNLRDQTLNACRRVDECSFASYKPAYAYERLCAELRSAVATVIRARQMQAFNTQSLQKGPMSEFDQNWTGCTHGGKYRGYGRGRNLTYRSHGGSIRDSFQKDDSPQQASQGINQGSRSVKIRSRQKKCYVGDQLGCWSNRHTLQEH